VGIYAKVMWPRVYDYFADQPIWRRYRKEQLACVDGEILEIGAGTGLNLPHYPPHIKRLTTVEPNPGMNRHLQKRIAETGFDVDQHMIRSESLPFDEASFDCVVSTLTLCSISDVKRALGEIHRVLKPGGRILFLEHGLSPDASIATWQRRLNPLQNRLADGCTLTLDVRALFATKSFTSIELDTFYMQRIPKTHGYMFQGKAIK
jgi:ubiquinone/menaquinone biosynthesis C-methylase UbiE